MAERRERLPRERSAVAVVATALIGAVALGAFALLADAISGPFGRVLLIVASTGLAWGAAAVALGAWSPRPVIGAVAGAIVMLGAVSSYYGGSAALGIRPASSDLLRAGVVWGVLAVVAGPTLGVAGWYAVRTAGRVRSAIWGALAGLLLAQGVHIFPRSFEMLLDPSSRPLLLLLVTSVAVPVVMVVLGSRRRHLVVGLAVMIAVGAVGGAMWSIVLDAV